jgi:hypothetical protein
MKKPNPIFVKINFACVAKKISKKSTQSKQAPNLATLNHFSRTFFASRPIQQGSTFLACLSLPGLPDFSWPKHTKTGRIYQMNINYTKWP